MYLFLPIVNKGLSIISKEELLMVIISFLGIFIIWKDFINEFWDPFKLWYGYSLAGLLLFFITGAYFHKYIIKPNQNRNIFYYIFCL